MAYLALALWAYRVVLPVLTEALPMPPAGPGTARSPIMAGDLKIVVATVLHNARTLLSHPSRVFDGVQCFPMPRAATVSEHMLAEGLLAAPTHLITGDPIASYNVMLVLLTWFAALAMYALAFHWTRSVPAALVAGLAFAFRPDRLVNTAHPFVSANLWTALALLFAHRLFTTARWTDAVALAAVTALQLLESIYQVLSFAIIGGVYGGALVARYRRTLPRILPKLALVVVATALMGWAVFGPYLEVRRHFTLLAGRKSLLMQPQGFGPGGVGWVGWTCALLAVVGLADRLRGPRLRAGSDPRLPLLLAGLLCVWAAIWGIQIPLIGIWVPSLLTLVSPVVPGLDAIRAAFLVHWGWTLVASLLAAYGMLWLCERRRVVTQGVVAAAATLAILFEVFVASPGTGGFGTSPALVAEPMRPSPEVEGLLSRVTPGPVLDIPLPFGAVSALAGMPGYVFASAFHRQQVAACYGSFPSAFEQDVATLIERLPDPKAVDALYALGFRNLLIHTFPFAPFQKLALIKTADELVRRTTTQTRAVVLGTASDDAGDHRLYRLDSAIPVQSSFDLLVPSAAPTEGGDVELPLGVLRFSFHVAPGWRTYRHPAPLWPSPLRLRWETPGGDVVATQTTTLMLPLAIAAGDTAVREIPVVVPVPPGDYVVSLAREAEPGTVLSRYRVRVVAGAGSTGPASPRSGSASG